MTENDGIDLDIAYRKIYEWGMEDGDLGYEYWYRVRKLLERAANMQAEIETLTKELEICRARRARQT